MSTSLVNGPITKRPSWRPSVSRSVKGSAVRERWAVISLRCCTAVNAAVNSKRERGEKW